MKLLFFLFISIFSATANAAIDFTYSETPEFSKPQLIDILEVQTELEQHGYWPLDLSHDQKLQSIGVDQIFFDSTANRYVLLKFGLKISEANQLGKVLEVDGDYVFHGEVGDKVPYALYFTKHSSKEVVSIVSGLGLKSSVTLLDVLLPQAHARSCSPSQALMMSALSLTVTSAKGLQQLGNCLLSADRASSHSIKQIDKSVKDFFTTNPLEQWAKIKAAAAQLTGALKLILKEADALVKEIGGLDNETKFQIACSLVGAASPMLAIAVLSAGSAKLTSARLLAILANQIRKARAMAPAFRAISLQRRLRGYKAADQAIDSVVACARR